MTQLAPPGPSQGPNGSVPFGQAGALDQLHQRLQDGPTNPNIHIPPPQSRPQQQPGGPPPQQGQQAGPVQPQPQAPQGQQQQGQQFPSPPQMLNRQQPTEPWRTRLQTWARHPDADPHLRALGAMSALDQMPAEMLRRLSPRAPAGQ